MVNARLLSRLRKIDWDFSGSYSESPFSALHWHPGRYASQIPASLLGVLAKPGGCVLDPFAGSGTTLVEAQRLGLFSIGCDINPVSHLICLAKTQPVKASTIAKDVAQIVVDLRCVLSKQQLFLKSRKPDFLIPESVQASKWYAPSVRSDLGRAWALINSYNGRKRVLAEAAFSASLISVCRETRHWGYICDNCQPQSDHESEVLPELVRFLNGLANGYAERDLDRQRRFGSITPIEKSQVICGDALESVSKLPAESVDIVVTSPPYEGVCDYVKAQRLSMEWFGHEIEPLRRHEVGARSKRHRRAALQQYLSEMEQIYRSVFNCLRKGGVCAIVLGQSDSRAAVLNPTKKSLSRVGFALDVDMNRSVSSQRRQAPSIRGEHILICSRP